LTPTKFVKVEIFLISIFGGVEEFFGGEVSITCSCAAERETVKTSPQKIPERSQKFNSTKKFYLDKFGKIQSGGPERRPGVIKTVKVPGWTKFVVKGLVVHSESQYTSKV
jgi:hypothetical protein